MEVRLSALKEMHRHLPSQPYSVVLRLKLAMAYHDLGYPDLAIGDAYKALLLTDEILLGGEYHEQALEAAKLDISGGQALATASQYAQNHSADGCDNCHCRFSTSTDHEGENGSEQKVMECARTCWASTTYNILIDCLIECGCLRSSLDFTKRALKAFPNSALFITYIDTINARLQAYFESKKEDFSEAEIGEYPDKGLARRELYPWNEYEPDRYSDETIQLLNNRLTTIAPRLEVKVAKLPVLAPTTRCAKDEIPHPEQEIRYMKQLGIFAKDHVEPGEVILQERSLLTAISRMHETYCDACSAPLASSGDAGSEGSTISCEDCNEVFFCSEECHDAAQDQYHPSLCGVTFEQNVSASEAADFLYSLLLVRAMALAENQKLHPLILNEVRYIWGDYHGLDLDQYWHAGSETFKDDSFNRLPKTLPFSFGSNVLFPLHILEKMDVNIFEQSHRYDTWIINTLYAKFRGTASAQQGPDGRPEIGAVHPIWCLANHSCDPNVAWEWSGSMKFWARHKLVEWEGRDPRILPGLRAGEEIFSHYCDIRLPVEERREWAMGALGGECMCPRCVWEEKHRTGPTTREQHRTNPCTNSSRLEQTSITVGQPESDHTLPEGSR